MPNKSKDKDDAPTPPPTPEVEPERPPEPPVAEDKPPKKPPALKEQPEGTLWSIAARVLTDNPSAPPVAEPTILSALTLESLDPAAAEPLLIQTYLNLLLDNAQVIINWETPLNANASWIHALWRTLALREDLRLTMRYYAHPSLVQALQAAHPLRALLPFTRPPIITEHLSENTLIVADAAPTCPMRTIHELRTVGEREDLVVHVGWKLNSIVAVARYQAPV